MYQQSSLFFHSSQQRGLQNYYRGHVSAAQGSRSGFFWSSKSKFPPDNFGSIIEVICNMAIRRQPLVRSARRGCRTKGLDPARQAMSYLPLTEFSLLLNDHSPPAGRRSDLLALLRPFSPHTLKCLASTNGNESSLAILPVVCESTRKNVCF